MDSSLSDDEIYFGKMSLKEVKCHLLDPSRKTFGCSSFPDIRENRNSIRLIKTSSEPDILTINDSTSSNYDTLNNEFNNTSDESFLKLERLVSNMSCTSESQNGINEKSNDNMNNLDNPIITNDTKVSPKTVPQILVGTLDVEKLNELSISKNKSSFKAQIQAYTNRSTTPNRFENATVFKTPANPSQIKKLWKTCVKKTPIKSYDHISSPVASYIKNSPQVPLLKDIRPKKPLPGSSAIPKFVKSQTLTKHNKENTNLPLIAYRSAKKTKVIHVPETSQLPQSQWAKRVASSLPQPMVIKHDHRQKTLKNNNITQAENSFGDLSLHQADVSVWTQKSALPIISPSKLKK